MAKIATHTEVPNLAAGWLSGRPLLGDILAVHANSFGVIRLAMALAVLLSHSYLLRYGTTSAEPLHNWTGHSLGEHAVQVFFFLSGILVAQSFDRSRSLLDFVSGRILRIFPGLAVCVFATVFVLGPFVSNAPLAAYLFDPETISYIARTLSLSTGSAPLPGVFEGHPMPGIVNMSLWTLKYEVLCYAGLAAAGAFGLFNPRWKGASVALLAVFVTLVFVSQPKPAETFTTLDNVRYFALFFATGTLAYLAKDWLRIDGRWLLPLFVAFVAAIGTRFAELSTALFLGYATLWVAKLSFGWLRTATARYDLSYGAYIYACPIQQMLIELAPGASALLLTGLALLIVMPLAFLSWVFVESPALAARRRLADAAEQLLLRTVRTCTAALRR